MEAITFSQAMAATLVPMHEIDHNLFLGGLGAGGNEALLKRTGIKFVVQLLENTQIAPRFPGITYHFIQIQDSPAENISRHLPDALKFIHRHLKHNQKVLVHCAAGVSRSASVVISYIMAKNNTSFLKALQYVRNKRNCVLPNEGFRRQLEGMNLSTLRGYLRIL
ncbi:unnamed protein product [Blepharisma stoltei]|uniref:Dual specificity protein phosphatase n=1 Tax=Blepharisma stoltei TaxID=1481888 RepID=A0AAU9J3D2_9CILI|nr:unnamed protein product [Blepharisma stoltei]